MRNLLALIGALVIVVGGLGWYPGWYKVQFQKAPDGNVRIEVDADIKKAGSDTGDAAKKVGAMIQGAAEKGGQDANPPQPGPPGNTPGPVTPPHNAPQQPAAEGGGLLGHGHGKK